MVSFEVIPPSEKKDQPYLRTEVLDLRGRISNHLDAVVVVGHGAGQVGDLDQFVGVLGENGGHLFHLEKAEVINYFSILFNVMAVNTHN